MKKQKIPEFTWLNFVQVWAGFSIWDRSEYSEYDYRALLGKGKCIQRSYYSRDFSVLSVRQKWHKWPWQRKRNAHDLDFLDLGRLLLFSFNILSSLRSKFLILEGSLSQREFLWKTNEMEEVSSEYIGNEHFPFHEIPLMRRDKPSIYLSVY